MKFFQIVIKLDFLRLHQGLMKSQKVAALSLRGVPPRRDDAAISFFQILKPGDCFAEPVLSFGEGLAMTFSGTFYGAIKY